MRCSFCGEGTRNAGRLVASAANHDVYICRECATVASAIANEREDPFTANPLLEEFLRVAERWHTEETQEHLSEVRRVAALMFAERSL